MLNMKQENGNNDQNEQCCKSIIFKIFVFEIKKSSFSSEVNGQK